MTDELGVCFYADGSSHSIGRGNVGLRGIKINGKRAVLIKLTNPDSETVGFARHAVAIGGRVEVTYDSR